ncbi:hypothetical protein M404DRAFT_33726 [Pisolithus tinctorius Marx 270]|uniref:Uncharacterized protein n=1 Tax=Pisolithus tinctorius Marx 270 TaxID=870435 RepID=A0A0C3N4I9_PISTI|nr:hypothetical protein M404DRAFT_33726 [Pisolithus tinctorius Marx 270]
MHTTQEAQAIADEYGKTLGSIMAAAGLTTKATHAESVWNMHQAWYAQTNPKASAEETKDYYRCHTKHYEDHKDEDKHPQLWAEIWKYWKYLSTIIKYKILNSAALVPLPDFNYTITDWPAGVPAVGLDFNVKCPNADELCALTVPFLKESMGADYHAEAPLDEEEDQAEYLVPFPNSSFYLKKWTDDQIELFRHSDARMCDIPLVVNTLNQHLHVLSDSDAFVKALPKGDKFKERSAPSSFSDQPVQG